MIIYMVKDRLYTNPQTALGKASAVAAMKVFDTTAAPSPQGELSHACVVEVDGPNLYSVYADKHIITGKAKTVIDAVVKLTAKDTDW